MKKFVFHSTILALLGLILYPPSVAHASSPPADSVHFCAPFDYEQWERDRPRSAAKRLAGVQESEGQLDPPFSGTVWIDPDIITSSDPTAFQDITAAGRGERTMFDRRVNDWITINAYLFNAQFDDGLTTEIQVNPEFSSASDAMVEANKYGRAIGQLPTVLRTNVETVWIHKGDHLWGGGNNNILIHVGMVSDWRKEFLEEVLVHEAAHTSLDGIHSKAPAWIAAQEADGNYISTYARDYPKREDIAESFLPYMAVRYRLARVSPSYEQTILKTMPNRIAYFDAQSFDDMYPITEDLRLPHSLTKVSGDGQEGLAGAQLAEPFVVSVLDENSAAMAGAVVTFVITAGRGMLSVETATTDADGQAATTLTLGSQPRTNTVEATVEGLAPVTFTAAAVEHVTKVSGDGQGGQAGAALAEPFVVSVLDQNGLAFAGAVVTFSVTAGGGTLSTAAATTDANGRARSTLTLGSNPGTNTVSATVEGLGTVTFTATAVEQTPHSLTKVSGDGQEGLAGVALAAPFVVSVLDEDDEAIAGVGVTFSVTAGEGILSSTTATADANGQATTTLTLTLGSDAETTTVAATVEGLESVTFTVTAVGQAIPDTLTRVSGDGQEGTVGEALAEPFVVSVLDEDGATIAGAVVTFSVTAGGGTLSAATATTDANGQAVTRLTLGSDAGTNTVSATVEGLESVTFTATAQESPFASLFDLFGGGKRVALPDSPQLAQNAPNPFNSQTVLSYFLHAPGPAHVEVFALNGQRVAVLHQGPQQAGYHRLHWDARDDAGRPVASGIYLYRLVTNEVVLTRKLLLLR